MLEDLFATFIAKAGASIKVATKVAAKAVNRRFPGHRWMGGFGAGLLLITPLASQGQTSQTVTWVGGDTLGRYSEPLNWNTGTPPVNNPGTNYVVVVGPNDSVLYDWLGPATLSSD